MKRDLTKTHERRILAWLLEGHEIDLQKSQAMFRCASLRSRIADLRKKGYAIKKRMQKFTAPSGAKVDIDRTREGYVFRLRLEGRVFEVRRV